MADNKYCASEHFGEVSDGRLYRGTKMKLQISQPLSPISSEEMEVINNILYFPMPQPSFDVIPRTPSPPRPEPVPSLIAIIETPPQPPTQATSPNDFQQIEQRMRDLFGEDPPNEPEAGGSNCTEKPKSPPPSIDKPTNSIYEPRNNSNIWSDISPPPVILTPEKTITSDPIMKTQSKPHVSKISKVPKQSIKKERAPRKEESVSSRSSKKPKSPKYHSRSKESGSSRSTKEKAPKKHSRSMEHGSSRSTKEKAPKKHSRIMEHGSSRSTKDKDPRLVCPNIVPSHSRSTKDKVPRIHGRIKEPGSSNSSKDKVSSKDHYRTKKPSSSGSIKDRVPKCHCRIKEPGSSGLSKDKVSKFHGRAKEPAPSRLTKDKPSKVQSRTKEVISSQSTKERENREPIPKLIIRREPLDPFAGPDQPRKYKIYKSNKKTNPTPIQPKPAVPANIPVLLLVPPERRHKQSNRLLIPRPGGGFDWMSISE